MIHDEMLYGLPCRRVFTSLLEFLSSLLVNTGMTPTQHVNSYLIFQIYVEIERARLTRTLAKIKEDAGKITEAANILQELQVIWRILIHSCN